MSNARQPFTEPFDSKEVSESMLVKLVQSQRDGEAFWQKLSKRIQNLQNLQSQSDISDEAGLRRGSRFMTPIAKTQVGLLASAILAAMVFATLYLAMKAPEPATAWSTPSTSGTTTEKAGKLAADLIAERENELVAISPKQPLANVSTRFLPPLKSSIATSCKFVGRQICLEAKKLVPGNTTVKAVENRTGDGGLVASLAKPVSVEPPLPRKHIELLLAFNKSGYGRLSINEEQVGPKMGPAQLAQSFGKIKSELAKRIAFIGPRIGSINGNLCIESHELSEIYPFDNINDLEWASKKIISRLGEVNSNYRRKSERVDPVTLVQNHAVEAINELFQKWGKETLESGRTEFRIQRDATEKYSQIIGVKEFKAFVKTGRFESPAPDEIYLPSTKIQHKNAEQLRQGLATVKEVSLFADPAQFKSFSAMVKDWKIKKSRTTNLQNEPLEPLKEMLESREDLKGLPIVMGDDCRMNEADSLTMHKVSLDLSRTMAFIDRATNLSSSVRQQQSPQQIKVNLYMAVKKIEQTLNAPERENQRLLTVDQILQARPLEMRKTFVKSLAMESSQTAANLLTCYVKYDLDESVRMLATKALSDFPRKSIRGKLLDGIDYPWTPAALHSAEALVRLNDTSAVPMLVEKLQDLNPNLMFEQTTKSYVKRELVAINHFKNCMLCHADGDRRSRGRAVVPEWDRPIPVRYYHSNSDSLLARADITYMRQDFSVMRNIADENRVPKSWPESQRFDYVVKRTTLADEAEYKSLAERPTNEKYQRRDAIIFALRKLTDLEPEDNSYENWKALTGVSGETAL